jgi:hypothetical protein
MAAVNILGLEEGLELEGGWVVAGVNCGWNRNLNHDSVESDWRVEVGGRGKKDWGNRGGPPGGRTSII